MVLVTQRSCRTTPDSGHPPPGQHRGFSRLALRRRRVVGWRRPVLVGPAAPFRSVRHSPTLSLIRRTGMLSLAPRRPLGRRARRRALITCAVTALALSAVLAPVAPAAVRSSALVSVS